MKPNMRLTIERKTSEGGNYPDSLPEKWDPLRVEWFSIEPLSGREYEEAMRMNSAVTHKGECEFFQGAKSLDMRLRNSESTRIFNIESVVNDKERNRKLVWRLIEVEVPATVEVTDG